jgi:transcriptional regulator with XRE-family HTH domain
MDVEDVIDLESLGAFLKASRLAKGLGQQQLAARAGMTKRTIRNYENGDFGGSQANVPDLCRVMAVLNLDDYDTILRFSYLLNSSSRRFTFTLNELPHRGKEPMHRMLVALATIVNVRDIHPTAGYAEAAVEILGRSLRSDGSSERSDSWLELLRRPASSGDGRGTEPSGRVAEMASAH